MSVEPIAAPRPPVLVRAEIATVAEMISTVVEFLRLASPKDRALLGAFIQGFAESLNEKEKEGDIL